ncbi:ferritin-like domain-containing protein [Chloroflexota bacterium]
MKAFLNRYVDNTILLLRTFVLRLIRRTTEKSPEAIELLNQALHLEYTLILYYPRIAFLIQDEEIAKLALGLGESSIRHVDMVARAISQLGGKPKWTFDPFPSIEDAMAILETQLEKEEELLGIYRRCIGLISDISLKDDLDQLVEDRDWHVRLVEDILSRLHGE